MDYIPNQSNFEDANDYIPRSPAPHIQSSDTPSNTPSDIPSNTHSETPSNTPSMPFAGSAGTSSSRGSKRKGPTMDGIDEHFALLNKNIQQCVSSIKHGNHTALELIDIARVQTTTTQGVAAKIRRRNDLDA